MKAMPLPAITPLIAARFWAKVDVGSDSACWNWTGTLTKTGYGHFSVAPGRLVYSHRVAYEILVAPAPVGFEQLDHLCRNRACCNPKHMEAVSLRVNVLRGISVSATNSAKTHCPAGHDLAGDNLYLKPRPNGKFARVCLICRRAHQRILD